MNSVDPPKQTITSENVTHFGTTLAQYKIAPYWVNMLNQVSDQILNKKKIPNSLNQAKKLFSAVNTEFVVPQPLINDFSNELIELAKNYHKQFSNYKTVPKFKMISTWIVSQREGEWNYLHTHSGKLSGVLYLKIPSNMTKGLSKEDKRCHGAGKITFTEGTTGAYRISSKSFRPKVGDLFIFPSELAHIVYPFYGNQERRSLSFNIGISENFGKLKVDKN